MRLSALRISTRLTIWYVTSFGLILVGLSFAVYRLHASQSRDRVDEELSRSADFLTSMLDSVRTDLPSLYDELLRATATMSDHQHGHRFVLSVKDSLYGDPLLHPLLPSLVHGVDRTDPHPYHTVTIHGEEYRTLTRNFVVSATPMTLVVLAPMGRLEESLDQLRNILLILIPLALLVAGRGGWWFARRILQPLRAVISTASEITSASLDRHVPLGKSDDELTQLAVTFNAMIDRLNNTFLTMQQFVADASHDFRTPLTVLQMELELILLRAGIDEADQLAIERCLIEVERLTSLATDLLLLARADANQLALERKRFRLDELVVECVSQLRHLAEGRQVRLAVTISDAVEIEADEGLLRRALMNILDNAITHTRPQTVVATDLGRESAWIRIRVTDQGRGLDTAQLERMFQRFQRGDNARSRKGTGLGLAIVKAVVEAHGGNVAMTSQLASGTTVTMYLPDTGSDSGSLA